MHTLESLDVKGKKVLVRVDFNVPFKNGTVTDTSRIEAHKETLEWLLAQGAFVTLVSHFGRPKGQVNADYSMAQLISTLQRTLNMTITYVADCVGPLVEKALSSQSHYEVLVLENSRFHAEEEKNDPQFAAQMAAPFDLFVMDAFSAAHRANASTEGVAHYLPSAFGRLIGKEIQALDGVAKNPQKPYGVVLGGAKVSDKIGVIDHLLNLADKLIIGGGMAFTFLKAQGHAVGKSLVDEERLDYARTVLETAKAKGVELLLPVDLAAAPSLDEPEKSQIIDGVDLPDDLMGLDIGPKTAKLFAEAIKGCKTLLWNGPMGVFETAPWDEGSRAVGQALVDATAAGALTVVGGGDTASCARKLGFGEALSHLSTGGGASLEYCEGKVLPGIAAVLASPENKK